MLIGTREGGKDDHKETGTYGYMGQHRWGEAGIFIAENQDGHDDKPAAYPEEAGQETNPTPHPHKEEEFKQRQMIYSRKKDLLDNGHWSMTNNQ